MITFLSKGDMLMNNQTFDRHRRLRTTSAMRTLVRETTLHVKDLIYPLFVIEGEKVKREVPSMPGVFQLSMDHLMDEMNDVQALGIKAVMLFGVPDEKDETGTGAYAEHGIVQEATRLIKENMHDMLVVADTCLCEYTSHGHCGVIEHNDVVNDAFLDLVVQTAVSRWTAAGVSCAFCNTVD